MAAILNFGSATMSSNVRSDIFKSCIVDDVVTYRFADSRFIDSRFADNYDSNGNPCLIILIGTRRVPKTLMIGSSYL